MTYALYQLPSKRCWKLSKERLRRTGITPDLMFRVVPAGAKAIDSKKPNTHSYLFLGSKFVLVAE